MYPLDYLKSNQNVNSIIYVPSRSIRGFFGLVSIFLKASFSSSKDSIIVFQKIYTTGLYSLVVRSLSRFKSNTMLDIDDAEYIRHSSRTLDKLIHRSKFCTVGSKSLLSYCSKLNSRVYLNTSPVLSHDKQKKEPKDSRCLRLVWTGDTGNGKPNGKEFSHKTSLFRILFPAMIESDIPIQLTLWGVKLESDIQLIREHFEDYPKISLTIPIKLDWSEDHWIYTEMSSMDFGVSPMVDHPFNRAKSAFKAKQCLSVGLPVIASDVGETSTFVKSGWNGYLCANKADFTQALQSAFHLSDSDYSELSRNAIDQKTDYSMSVYADRLLSLASAER